MGKDISIEIRDAEDSAQGLVRVWRLEENDPVYSIVGIGRSGRKHTARDHDAVLYGTGCSHTDYLTILNEGALPID